MKLNENLTRLVGECVSKNLIFDGAVGTTYTIQDLLHNCAPSTLNKMWKRAKNALAALDTDSLYENSNTTKKNTLSLQVETIKEAFTYVQGKIETKSKREAEKANKVEKLAILKKIKTEKELEAMGSLTLEEVNKQIEEAEGLVSS